MNIITYNVKSCLTQLVELICHIIQNDADQSIVMTMRRDENSTLIAEVYDFGLHICSNCSEVCQHIGSHPG